MRFIGLACVLISTIGYAAAGEPIIAGEKIVIRSDVLGEDRTLWVGLPADYAHHDRAYPVLYLLDGAENFAMASGVADFLSRERGGKRRIPELIIVGVENTDRVRDLTPVASDKDSSGFVLPEHENSGAAAAFLAFIETELTPEIERRYRAGDGRILVGHSYGGLFALYTLLERPSLFSGIVAIDPSLYFADMVLVNRLRERAQADPGAFSGAVFISMADHPATDEFVAMVGGITRFAGILSGVESERFRSTLEKIPRESHGTVGLLSLYAGLCFIFPADAPGECGQNAGGKELGRDQ